MGRKRDRTRVLGQCRSSRDHVVRPQTALPDATRPYEVRRSCRRRLQTRSGSPTRRIRATSGRERKDSPDALTTVTHDGAPAGPAARAVDSATRIEGSVRGPSWSWATVAHWHPERRSRSRTRLPARGARSDSAQSRHAVDRTAAIALVLSDRPWATGCSRLTGERRVQGRRAGGAARWPVSFWTTSNSHEAAP